LIATLFAGLLFNFKFNLISMTFFIKKY
jgi:hypothetical protein